MFRPAELDRDLEAELALHAELLAEENTRRGMSPEQAERAARLTLGGVSQLREAQREVRSLPWLESSAQDLRYALRSLRRDLGFTTFALAIVALGVAATATLASLAHALLWRPLPVSDAERLVWVQAKTGGVEGDLSNETLQVDPFREFASQSESFAELGAYFAFYGSGARKLTGQGEPERLTGVPVSRNLFALLGASPRLGRDFSEEEAQGDLPVVILDERMWRRRFASDPSIVGRTFRGSSAGRGDSRLRAGLVVAEVCFACVLLVGAGLLVRSLSRVLDEDLGFQPRQALAIRLEAKRLEASAQSVYFDDLLTLARGVPGVEVAALADMLPLESNRSWGVGLPGEV